LLPFSFKVGNRISCDAYGVEIHHGTIITDLDENNKFEVQWDAIDDDHPNSKSLVFATSLQHFVSSRSRQSSSSSNTSMYQQAKQLDQTEIILLGDKIHSLRWSMDYVGEVKEIDRKGIIAVVFWPEAEPTKEKLKDLKLVDCFVAVDRFQTLESKRKPTTTNTPSPTLAPTPAPAPTPPTDNVEYAVGTRISYTKFEDDADKSKTIIFFGKITSVVVDSHVQVMWDKDLSTTQVGWSKRKSLVLLGKKKINRKVTQPSR